MSDSRPPIALLAGLALFSAALAALGVSLLVRSDDTEGIDRGDLQGRLDDVILRLDGAQEDNERLRRDLEALKKVKELPIAAVPSGEGLNAAEVEAIVRRLLAENGGPTAKGAPKPAEDVPGIEDLMARLQDPNLSGFERMQIMDRLAKAGKIDAVIAMYKDAVKNSPRDADRQVDLGMAFITKLRSDKVSQMDQAMLGMAADKAFDNALKIDGEHWDARFNKAISLSFWPPAMGKQPEAIRHFETLLEQQGRRTPSPEHAQTHIFLGNLYQQSGKPELAQQTWAAGAELFPENEQLQAAMNNGGGN